MYNPFDHELSPGPALGLGHLGNHLGPPTRERPPNFGAKIEIYIYIYIFFFFNIYIYFLGYRKKN